MRSSYIENNYGAVFQSIVLMNKPKKVIEFGILDGYCTYNIAKAIKFNKEKYNIDCVFESYDIFDDYEFKHGDIEEVKNIIKNKDLYDYVDIKYGDIFEIYKKIEENSVDLLFIDISNDGDKIKRAIKLWSSKVKGMIIIEGGSIERDNGWIKKYNKEPIRPLLENNIFINETYNWFIFEKYPSVTLLMKNEI